MFKNGFIGVCLLALAGTTAFASGVAPFGGIEGSGNIVSRTLDVDGFTAIATGWGSELTVRQGDDYRVELRADDNIMEILRVELRDEQLRFDFPPGERTIRNATIEIDIVMPMLERLDLSGGSGAEVAMDLRDGSFRADLSGGSELTGTLGAERVRLEGSGGSRFRLQGRTSVVEADGSGAARFYLFDFPTTRVDADLSGGSVLEADVSEELRVDASGGSTVRYEGSPARVRAQASGGSTVRERS